jgi:ABC-type sugar transport system substrate-binding protein
MFRHTSRMSRALLPVAAAALVLGTAACGSGAGGSTGGSPSSAPAAAGSGSKLVVIITPSPDNVFFKAEQDAAAAKAKALGYEVRRSKIEGSCYEVYGVKEGKLYELFYSPEDLSLKHTIAK